MSDEVPGDLRLTPHAARGVRLLQQAANLGVPWHYQAVEIALLSDTPTIDPNDPAEIPDQHPGPTPAWLELGEVEVLAD